jgi:hypothetical protein
MNTVLSQFLELGFSSAPGDALEGSCYQSDYHSNQFAAESHDNDIDSKLLLADTSHIWAFVEAETHDNSQEDNEAQTLGYFSKEYGLSSQVPALHILHNISSEVNELEDNQ